MMGYGFGYMGSGSIVFWLVLIVLVGLAVWAIIRLSARGTTRSSDHTAISSESALDILKKRYARGEITPEQFDVMRKDLVE